MAIILEILIPSGFFLNFAIGGIITAILSIFITSLPILIIDFVIISFLSIFLLKPLLARLKSSAGKEKGSENSYIGQIARVIEPVSKTEGAVTIYEERWTARLDENSEIDSIPVGEEVKITRNESLILYVDRV